MLWMAAIVVAYGLLVVVVYTAQDRLVFPGARFGAAAPLPRIESVTVQPLVLADGIEVRVAESRARGAVKGVMLFFVGNGEDLTSGVGWASELAGYGLHTIVPEYPGYGTSAGEPSVASFDRLAAAAFALAQQRADAHQVPIVLGGFSMGTFCAVQLAAAQRGTRLLLGAPPASILESSQDRFWWLPVKLLLKHRFDNLADAHLVKVPTLVIHGDVDRVVPLVHGEKVARAIAGPTEWIVAPGMGHSGEMLLPSGPFGLRVGEFLRGQ